MRIDYIAHASLAISTSDHRIALDPWWTSGCYADQWHVFPRPVDTSRVEAADTILISHGHADHLHEPTLRSLAAGKNAYYPYYWYGGTVDWLQGMGFATVTEALSEKTYALSENTAVTFLVCGQDALMVIEEGDKVLVNVNDALHSTPDSTIELYCARIRKRWPDIDYVFCGFGGASYYPNVFRADDRDERAIGRLREEFFVAAFCKIVKALNPRVAVPFAADFVLLHPSQRWINEIRFPREEIPAYFDCHYRSAATRTQVAVMYPGDYLLDHELHPVSPYRARLACGALDQLVDEQYPVELSAFSKGRELSPEETAALSTTLAAHLSGQVALRSDGTLDGLLFSLGITGPENPQWFDIRIRHADVDVTRVAQPHKAAVARITTGYDALVNSITEDWGGDDIIIGYGCEVTVKRSSDLPLARTLTELLVRHPQPRRHARRQPLRMLRYVVQTWFANREKLRAKLLRRHDPSDDAIKSNMWLTASPERLRTHLGLPRTSGSISARRTPGTVAGSG